MRLFQSKNLNMTEGRPLRLLLAFSVPLILGNVFQQMYTVTDTAIVGQGVGMMGLAALGAVDWLAWLPFCIPQGFSQGFSVRASQRFGEGDADEVRRIAGHSASISLILGVICTVIFTAAIPLLLRLLKVREDLTPLATQYLDILFGGFLFAVFYNYSAAMLRAVGDSKTPLIAMVISSVINIGLDAYTVFVLNWGIVGAASATVFSQVVSGLVCFIRMRRIPELRFTWKDMKLEKKLAVDLIRLGMPMCLMNFVICIGGLIVVSVVNTCSIPFIAGYTATNKIYGLLEIAAVSYGYALTTYVGQNYGAHRPDRIKEGVRTGILLCAVTAVLIGGCMLLFGRHITNLFLSREDPTLYAAASDAAYTFLSCMSCALPILYLLYGYRSALQGMGDAVSPMISGCLETVLRVSAAALAARAASDLFIFLAEPIAWIGGMLVLAFMYAVRKKAL